MDKRVIRAGQRLLWAALAGACALLSLAGAAEASPRRFPRPEFESGYVQPTTTTPEARLQWLEYADVLVLLVTLSVASYLALKARSRRGLWLLSLFSILYFGFWRGGCVCPVGAIQDVVAAIADRTFVLPVTVLVIFLMPLVFAWMFGRTFCAAVCPLGAIQDVVLWRPIRLPASVSAVLGLFPFIYLGLAVLMAATGARYVICRYDPFIPIYRMGGDLDVIVLGVSLLVLGLFVGRPYSRFLCPYGVLLNWISKTSVRHVTISPTDCIGCRLCEQACPFDSIRVPGVEDKAGGGEPRVKARSRLVLLLGLLPVMVAAGAGAGWIAYKPLARSHATVSLSDRIRMEDAGQVKGLTVESEAFRATARSTVDLHREALAIEAGFRRGTMVLGVFLALVVGVKLIALSVRRVSGGYSIDRGSCLSCARCFQFCPREHERLETCGRTP
jgi:polyferredoxin